jgi:YHS domain-containing protein
MSAASWGEVDTSDEPCPYVIEAEMSAANEPPCRLERDPVCGRELPCEQALLRAESKGRTYLFCSERRRMPFSIRPGWFVDRAEETAQPKAS